MKSEPDEFGIDHLQAAPNQTHHWDGVRNYQARNMIRDQMQVGDLAFFYHASCPETGIAGVMEVTRAAYPDPSAWDPRAKYYDPKSSAAEPRWFMVDVTFRRRLKRVIGLQELKGHADQLGDLPLLRKGNRLSVMPVTASQWRTILDLE